MWDRHLGTLSLPLRIITHPKQKEHLLVVSSHFLTSPHTCIITRNPSWEEALRAAALTVGWRSGGMVPGWMPELMVAEGGCYWPREGRSMQELSENKTHRQDVF
jgi:hypothetical protein